MKAQVVSVTFLDHCQTSGAEAKPIECVAYGRLIREDKLCYYVASWLAEDSVDINTEQYVILKSTVKKLKRLK